MILNDKFEDWEIILASQSPRRQELLKKLDINFRIDIKPVEEIYGDHLKGGEITAYLSVLKAQGFKRDIRDHQLVITSDTIVWLDGKAMGKPKNKQDALDMLQMLSNTSHEVFTSVTFTTASKQETITDKTSVYFKELSQEEIAYYVNNYTPLDRAGSYGIQDWIGYIGIEKLEGCYYNVMGLPLPKVYAWLQSMDVNK